MTVTNVKYVFITALADGALDPVLTVCAMKEDIALLALMTLSHIVEHQGNLAPLIEVIIYILIFIPVGYICLEYYVFSKI